MDTILGMVEATSENEQKEFRQLLDLLAGRMAGLIWAGKWKPFAELPAEDQVKLLQKWSRSWLRPLRKAFVTLKKLSLFVHYGQALEDGHADWKVIGYPGPLLMAPSPAANRIPILRPKPDAVLDCDVVVVGSGAGGGIAAGILAEAGHAVVVLEKGPYLEGEDFTDQEVPMIRRSYEKQGAMVTQDGGVGIFAGACLGGGTTINWTASFATPDYTRRQWAVEAGLKFADSPAYAAHIHEVMASIGVNGQHSPHNPQNQALWRGAVKLGHGPEVIERNVQHCGGDGCKACGYCTLGCRQGHKQSTAQTWLRRAVAAGARVVVDAQADRIEQAGGKVSGIVASYRASGQAAVSFRIRAKRVVLAAGALHSPALLLRSGVQHAGIGHNLFFHPTVVMAGFYPEAMHPWYGPMMSAVDKSGMNLDRHYGYWIETPPVHVGLAALALPWEHPGQHYQDMQRIQQMAAFVVLTRDRFGGRVKIDRQGQPQVAYRLHAYDRAHMLKGIRTAFELHRAAGAQEVVFPHFKHSRYDIQRSKMAAETFVGNMQNWGWQPNRFGLFTAHQMGTCAMGEDGKRHAFTPEGECRAVKGLYIADGSALPSSAGVNPMVSIMALAAWVAKGLA